MKLKPLILFLFVCSSLAAQNTFNWGDKVFNIEGKRRIYLVYELDKAVIRPEAYPILDSIVAFMKTYAYLKIEIANHNDPRGGTAQRSMRLSQARAQCVVNYLMTKGIDSARLIPKGYEATQPLPGCSARDIALMKTQEEKEKAWQSDRRTEVVITSTCYKHETFNYNDSAFYVGSKRRVKVVYDLDNGRLTEGSKVIIDSVVVFMKNHPTFKIEIADHTDPRGSAEHNMRLSEARAQSVVDYMRASGVDSARMVSAGYGFTQPLPGCSAKDIVSMKTPQEKEAAWQADRRTEVVILEK